MNAIERLRDHEFRLRHQGEAMERMEGKSCTFTSAAILSWADELDVAAVDALYQAAEKWAWERRRWIDGERDTRPVDEELAVVAAVRRIDGDTA